MSAASVMTGSATPSSSRPVWASAPIASMTEAAGTNSPIGTATSAAITSAAPA
jgi:hypothetical protein